MDLRGIQTRAVTLSKRWFSGLCKLTTTYGRGLVVCCNLESCCVHTVEVAGSNPAAPNGKGLDGQEANRRSLKWLFRKMLTDVASAARSEIRSTIRSTKSEVLYDLGGFRRSPRACKSLKNLKRQDCHGRGRGFEPRRPRHTFLRT